MALPRVIWNVEGREVAVGDWTFSTIANGGMDRFNLVVPERIARRFSDEFDQGAICKAVSEHGDYLYEGRIIVRPSYDNNRAFVVGAGHQEVARKSTGRRLFQSRDIAQLVDSSGAPFDDKPAVDIEAVSDGGAVVFRTQQGQAITSGNQRGRAWWTEGSKIRRFQATIDNVGPNTDVQLRLYRCTGPAGSRTSVGTKTLTGGSQTWDISISPSEDMIVLVAESILTKTTTASTQVYVRDIRINDLTTADSLSISNAVETIGELCGYDVDGVSEGTGASSIGKLTVTPTATRVKMYATDPRTGALQRYWAYTDTATYVSQSAVITSALNVLPLDWTGSDADLLSYLVSLVDYRWLVLGNWNGRGPVLQVGGWGPTWEISNASAKAKLSPLEMFNEVVVSYRNNAGQLGFQTAHSDPDTLPVTNKYFYSLEGVQADSTLADTVAGLLLPRVSSPRYQGTIEVVHPDAYLMQAGHVARISDWGPNESLEVRISQTEASPRGVRFGVDGSPYDPGAGHLALRQKREQRGRGIYGDRAVTFVADPAFGTIA